MSAKEKFQKAMRRFGLILAGLFFVVSAVIALRNHSGVEQFASDTKVITFAHWQLEDGFREGIDEAIKLFEAEKAKEGVKVKVKQIAVPVRGYSQWFLTQLIGGDPADLMELLGSSDIHNRYFVPLSPYIGARNKWNAETPLANYSWRESFADDMLSSLDAAYSEFFGVNIFMYTTRVYVNMDLYRAACGDAPLPRTVSEWLAACEKIREHGRKTGKPLVPIGVRGFDKNTLSQLLTDYNCQFNAKLADTGSPYAFDATPAELFRQINAGELDKELLLNPVKLVAGIGTQFADGFPSIDLEQTKYLFASGMIGFFIDGTYNAWSMVNNSPFEVAIIRMPVIGGDHELGKFATGEVSELGYGIGGRIGITRQSPNFDLALDFLRFLTSYRISRMTMVDSSKWLSPLKEMRYSGIMKDIEPLSQTEYAPIALPFETGSYARRIILQQLEKSIIDRDPNPGRTFWNTFVKNRAHMIDELHESYLGTERTLWNMDGTASALRLGASIPDTASEARKALELRGNINLEGIVSRFRALDNQKLLIDELGKLKTDEGE